MLKATLTSTIFQYKVGNNGFCTVMGTQFSHMKGIRQKTNVKEQVYIPRSTVFVAKGKECDWKWCLFVAYESFSISSSRLNSTET